MLPLLRERFNGIDGSILRSGKLCSYEHDLAMRYAKDKYDLAIDRDKCRLDISKFDVNDTALVTCIIRLFLNEKTLMPPEFESGSRNDKTVPKFYRSAWRYSFRGILCKAF